MLRVLSAPSRRQQSPEKLNGVGRPDTFIFRTVRNQRPAYSPQRTHRMIWPVNRYSQLTRRFRPKCPGRVRIRDPKSKHGLDGRPKLRDKTRSHLGHQRSKLSLLESWFRIHFDSNRDCYRGNDLFVPKSPDMIEANFSNRTLKHDLASSVTAVTADKKFAVFTRKRLPDRLFKGCNRVRRTGGSLLSIAVNSSSKIMESSLAELLGMLTGTSQRMARAGQRVTPLRLRGRHASAPVTITDLLKPRQKRLSRTFS